jgi:hypothetical protein
MTSEYCSLKGLKAFGVRDVRKEQIKTKECRVCATLAVLQDTEARFLVLLSTLAMHATVLCSGIVLIYSH